MLRVLYGALTGVWGRGCELAIWAPLSCRGAAGINLVRTKEMTASIAMGRRCPGAHSFREAAPNRRGAAGRSCPRPTREQSSPRPMTAKTQSSAHQHPPRSSTTPASSSHARPAPYQGKGPARQILGRPRRPGATPRRVCQPQAVVLTLPPPPRPPHSAGLRGPGCHLPQGRGGARRAAADHPPQPFRSDRHR